ncbi:MAG TPA: HD domain-containing phosphohydrolase, partial [Gallionellaceae bacterium]|nr:HD domain-containing phosphohydrolase [Gallionellaceae bacterium]
MIFDANKEQPAAEPTPQRAADIGDRTALQAAYTDPRSQQLIRQAHQEWLAALDAIRDPIFIHDKDFRVTRSNRAYADFAGLPVKEVVGKPYYEMFPRMDGPLPACQARTHQGGVSEEEVRLADGRVFLSRATSVLDPDGVHRYSLHIMYDITARKQMEQALRDGEERLLLALGAAQQAWFDLNVQTGAASVSPEYARMLGYDVETFDATLQHWIDDLHPEEREAAMQMYRQAIDSGEASSFEYRRRTQAGEWKWFRTVGKVVGWDEQRRPLRMIGIHTDITQRKHNEQALLDLNRVLMAFNAGNHELIHATDEIELLRAMCRVIVDKGGYRMAWVGYPQQDAAQSIKPMAQAGHDDGYLQSARISWADTEHGRGPAGRAVRSGEIQIAQNILNDPDLAPWRTEAARRGYASLIALPLLDQGRVLGVLAIYAAEADAFDESEITLLREMSGDLAFGIATLRLRQEQQRSAEQLRKGLEDTVQSIAAMVEMRDPYTAGHQRRVADLAAAIAAEMGLSADRAHGIHLAGSIHDLGKIQVPAEILSKPRRLSEIEYSLVKEHPQSGYDILKNIDFPWPIAQMVLQHHERLDGSGYPQGLKG